MMGKPGMLQSMGSQRVGYDCMTELNELPEQGNILLKAVTFLTWVLQTLSPTLPGCLVVIQIRESGVTSYGAEFLR